MRRDGLRALTVVRHLRIWGTRHAGAAYAGTIHKSQGSEYHVIIPMLTQHTHAAAEPSLHRCHTRQAAGRGWSGRRSRRHRGAQYLGPAALGRSLGRVAASLHSPLTADPAWQVEPWWQLTFSDPSRHGFDGVRAAWTLPRVDSFAGAAAGAVLPSTAIHSANELMRTRSPAQRWHITHLGPAAAGIEQMPTG